jgi:hypothetical protein
MNKLRSIILVVLAIVMASISPAEAETTTRDVEGSNTGFESGVIAMAYEPNTWMISSQWNQRPPYNNECPQGLLGPCSWPNYGYYNDNARVGCTATAAAQILRYWSWPPGYKWLNMLDEYIYDPAYNPPFKDGNGNQVTQAQIDAVAELCHYLGLVSGMVYECSISTTLTPLPMAEALKNYLAYNAGHELGTFHDMSSWHDFIKTELNANRPVLYGNGGENHSYVIDGWRQNGDNVEWHINYGWRRDCSEPNGCNTWYSRDYPPLYDAMVRDIKPVSSLGGVISGTYTGNGGYRYFDQDCTNYVLTPTVTFEANQNLQFLPGVKLRCIESPEPGTHIRFEGTSSENTRLFSIKGTQSAGIKIGNGAIELYPGGGLRFLSRQEFTKY